MTDPEQLHLTQRLGALRGPLSLRLELGPEPQHPWTERLQELAEALTAAAPGRLKLTVDHGGPHPSLSVSRVRYLAHPDGAELDPFLELLLQLDEALASSAPPPDGLGQEVSLLLLIAPTCPRCAGAVKVCQRLTLRRPLVRLTVADAQQFPALAGGCRSVPTLIIDERRALVGPLTLERLEAELAERGRPGQLAADLASLVQAGRLADAGRLLAEPDGPAAFAALFAEGTLAERVGLLLLAEETLARDPCILDGALPHLLPVGASSDPSRRGDLADLLGRIGSPSACQALQGLLADEHPEVRQAARDSLATRMGPN